MTGFVTVKRREQAAPVTFAIREGTSDTKSVLEVFKNNSYQRKRFKVEPGERWLDLGANVGAFSVFAASLGCSVKGYEAEPENADIARANIARNGLTGTVVTGAVVPDTFEGDHVALHVCERPMQKRRHSLFKPKSPHAVKMVPAFKFSTLDFARFDCVKANIEGVEVPIMGTLADHYGIRKLVFEWSFDKEPRVAVFRAMLDNLRRFFPWVEANRTIPPDLELYQFYPPNAFVYAMR